MADIDACAALRQADQAWLDLSTGNSTRVVVDQNGARVEYNTANRAGLLSFIRVLQGQCTTYQSVALGQCNARPMRFLF